MGRLRRLFMALLTGASAVLADEKVAQETTGQTPPAMPALQPALKLGYIDENRDGINDLFQDANGDGINDVTRQIYRHHFQFVDANGDGINDLFVDRDGDGVNDLDGHFADANGDGICDNVVDYDGDGLNDITGIVYHHRSLEGFRFGRMDEERGTEHLMFIDEDGDGMNDLRMPEMQTTHSANGMDIFIDEDGDGICDGRTFHRTMMQEIVPGVERYAQPIMGSVSKSGPMMPDRQQHKMGSGK